MRPGYFADLRMQRAAERDVHFLQAAADAEHRYAARDAGFRQRQRDVVAMDVVGLVPLMRLGLEARRVNIGARAGQHHAIDRVEQGADIGDLGRCRRTSAALRPILRQRREGCALRPSVSGNDFRCDGRSRSHRPRAVSSRNSAFIVLRKDLLGWAKIPADHACEIAAGSTCYDCSSLPRPAPASLLGSDANGDGPLSSA